MTRIPTAAQELSGPPRRAARLRQALSSLGRWFDTDTEPHGNADSDRIDWLRTAPFIAVHLACLAVFRVGVSPLALKTAAGLYVLRMFAITGFYHRYFAHRTFRTSRPVQFFFACLGAASVQRGPLWWAAHHRTHHISADTASDPHSPQVHGFLWSHMGWFLTSRGFRTDWKRIPDLVRYPELRWLDRYDVLIPVLLASALFVIGARVGHLTPASGVSGGQLLVWGFFISTVVLFDSLIQTSPPSRMTNSGTTPVRSCRPPAGRPRQSLQWLPTMHREYHRPSASHM